MSGANDILSDFLVECRESLDQLDRDLLELEHNPRSEAHLGRIFRIMHTIKGSCGMLGLPQLEALAHVVENLLSEVRDGRIIIGLPVANALLQAVDAIRSMLQDVEVTGQEGQRDYSDLASTIVDLCAGATTEPTAAAPSATAERTEPTTSEFPVSGSDGTLRVDVGLLDTLMKLAGELVLVRNLFRQLADDRRDQALTSASQRLNRITADMQDGIMKARMQPIGHFWGRLPRLVRDVAQNCHKEVALTLEGTETEIDKTLLEAIKDPLTHLVRNAIDHGIEAPEARRAAGKAACGSLTLRAYHMGGQVYIEVIDDGLGLDLERIRRKALKLGLFAEEQVARMNEAELTALIFHPGFSTAEQVTSLSGRGVGMDVVKTNIERIGGAIDVRSTPGVGTTFRLQIPLTLAILPSLLVACGAERYAISQANVLELVRLTDGRASTQISHIGTTPVYRLRGATLPLVFLGEVLGNSADRQLPSTATIVVMASGDRPFGLVVDAVRDAEEIVVQPMNAQLSTLSCYAGATILGDGRVALILDVAGLARHANLLDHQTELPTADNQAALAESATEQAMLLLVNGPDDARLAVPLTMVTRLEHFPRSAIEKTSGRPVVQYRGDILDLVPLSDFLPERRQRRRSAASPAAATGPVPVIVHAGAGRSVGIVVDRIIDIVADTPTLLKEGGRPGVIGSGVIQGRVTEFLDLASLIASSGRRAAVTAAAEEMAEQ